MNDAAAILVDFFWRTISFCVFVPLEANLSQLTAGFVSTDNVGARDLSYNPEHHERTKHIERRHFYVRDMVEKGELTVPYVSTHENLADFLTKPLDSKRFYDLRKTIMNETGAM